MRDKTTRKAKKKQNKAKQKKASHESNASLFPVKIRQFLMKAKKNLRHICENQCGYTPER